MKTTLFLCVALIFGFSARLAAQTTYPYPPTPPVYAPFGYKFVPADGDTNWGGEIWFSVFSETNGVTGLNYETDLNHSFIITSEGSFALNFGRPGWPVTPSLPQSPFPYSGTLRCLLNDEPVGPGWSGTFGNTWNGSIITTMNLEGSGQLEWLDTNDAVSQFQDTNIFAVIEDYGFTLLSNSISLQLDFQSWSWQQVLNDPSYSNTVIGQWVAIPPIPINVTAKALPVGLSLTWNSVPGKTYQVFASTNLSAPRWYSYSATITATNDTTTWQGLPNIPQSFFHVSSP